MAVTAEVDVAAMLRDPHDTYARLRELGSVVHVPALQRHLVVGFAACRAVEADQATYSADVGGSGATMARALGATPMLRRDDPRHAQERAPINPGLRARSVRASWAPRFEHNARLQLEVLRGHGPERAELDRDYAAPVAARNLVDLLGLREATPEQMERWSHAFIAGVGNLGDDATIWARCDDAQREVDDHLDALLPHLRRHPDASMTSALVNSGLDEAAVRANVKLTISGGLNEPQHMVTNTVWALSRHPDQRDRVLADPALWPVVFDEALRWLSPIGMYPRETTRATVLDGVELPGGAALGVVIGAANRDPAAFGHPDRFDISRPERAHLGFGSGVHLCPGHWAARIAIGEIAVPLLYAALPGLRTDPRRDEAWSGWVFRGLTTLPVTWDPA
ncbi:cytochrome P450 [Actinomycetospora chlora]|uniref:Cytochrome P450 n=1 Tax=Actinomycetospora chlora TaxID=663608 RepID=A0ABP9BBR5_9PSEU